MLSFFIGDLMAERYQFRDADTDELMHEIFNSDERLEAREYKNRGCARQALEHFSRASAFDYACVFRR